MHADHDFGRLFAGRNRQRIVEILRVEGVDGQRQRAGMIFARNLPRLDFRGLLVILRGVNRGQIVFRHDGVEVGGDDAGAPEHLTDRATPDTVLMAQQFDLHPVAPFCAVPGTGYLDFVRHALVERPDPVPGQQFPDQLLTVPADHFDDFPGRPPVAVARVVVARRQKRDFHVVAVHRVSDELRRNEDILRLFALLVLRQRHKTEPGVRDRDFPVHRLEFPFAAHLRPLGNAVQPFLFFFFHKNPP